MFVVPLKWLPYLLVAVGLYCLITEDPDLGMAGSIVMTSIGVIWLCIQSGMKRDAARKTQAQQAAQPVTPAPVVQQTGTPAQGAKNFCTRCGAKISQNDKFCAGCGNALQ